MYMYKFISKDNHYEDYEIVETQTFKNVPLFENNSIVKTSKLFSNDTFDYEEGEIKRRSYRSTACKRDAIS